MYSLGKEHGGREVMAQSQHLWYSVIPVEILGVDAQKVTAGQRSSWGVEDIETLVDKLTQFTKALVHRPDVGRLLS